MERAYRASNGIFFYAFFLALDAVALGRDGVNRLRQALTFSGALFALLALVCAVLAIVLLWRWGRTRIVITPDAMLIRGGAPLRRIYWADVDQVREIRGPSYQLALRHLLPGPFLPHTLLRGETVLEVVARPGARIFFRQALVDGYGSLREDVLRLISKTAEVDLHGRWWREDA